MGDRVDMTVSVLEPNGNVQRVASFTSAAKGPWYKDPTFYYERSLNDVLTRFESLSQSERAEIMEPWAVDGQVMSVFDTMCAAPNAADLMHGVMRVMELQPATCITIRTAFHAVQKNNASALRAILEWMPSLATRDYNAPEEQSFESLPVYLRRHPNSLSTICQDRASSTLLRAAMILKHVECSVQLLPHYSVEQLTQCKNSGQESLAMTAVLNNCATAVQAMIDRGVDFQQVHYQNDFALQWAVYNNAAHVAWVLLTHFTTIAGFDINGLFGLKNQRRLVTEVRYVDILPVLLNFGLKVTTVTTSGKTGLQHLLYFAPKQVWSMVLAKDQSLFGEDYFVLTGETGMPATPVYRAMVRFFDLYDLSAYARKYDDAIKIIRLGVDNKWM
jgi:hypothetical protein